LIVNCGFRQKSFCAQSLLFMKNLSYLLSILVIAIFSCSEKENIEPTDPCNAVRNQPHLPVSIKIISPQEEFAKPIAIFEKDKPMRVKVNFKSESDCISVEHFKVQIIDNQNEVVEELIELQGNQTNSYELNRQYTPTRTGFYTVKAIAYNKDGSEGRKNVEQFYVQDKLDGSCPIGVKFNNFSLNELNSVKVGTYFKVKTSFIPLGVCSKGVSGSSMFFQGLGIYLPFTQGQVPYNKHVELSSSNPGDSFYTTYVKLDYPGTYLLTVATYADGTANNAISTYIHCQ